MAHTSCYLYSVLRGLRSPLTASDKISPVTITFVQGTASNSLLTPLLTALSWVIPHTVNTS